MFNIADNDCKLFKYSMIYLCLHLIIEHSIDLCFSAVWCCQHLCLQKVLPCMEHYCKERNEEEELKKDKIPLKDLPDQFS